MTVATTDVVTAVLLLATGLAAQRWAADLRTLPGGVRPRGTSSVSVVVPARDEAATLPTLLGSLRALHNAPSEVVVVDDGSLDSTASVARAFGASVVEVSDPPSGWTGKAWACHLGAGRTTGEMLLFLDADTELAPGALDGLLEVHRGYGGLVSVQPFHLVPRAYEQASAYFNTVSLLASGAFGRRPAGRAMAFGPCLLTSRADYERAGGHGAVRAEILDDVMLAAAYERAGLPVRCLVGGRSVRMRMYPGGPRQLAEGWTKNIASGASAAAPVPTAASVLWVGAHHAVAVGAGVALLGWLTGVDPPWVLGHPGLWVAAWVGVAGQLRWLLRRTGSFRWWTWALFPLPLLAFDVIFARSALRTLVRRSVRWRGRDIRVGGHPSVSEDT